MPRYQEQFALQLSLADSMEICREVVADSDWNVVQQNASSLVCKEGSYHVTKVTWPITVEIVLSAESSDKTSILLQGSNFGFGPIQKNHLRGQLGSLRNKIELAVSKDRVATARSASASIASELEKLADLHARGLLTDDEFGAAKTRLLNQT